MEDQDYPCVSMQHIEEFCDITSYINNSSTSEVDLRQHCSFKKSNISLSDFPRCNNDFFSKGSKRFFPITWRNYFSFTGKHLCKFFMHSQKMNNSSNKHNRYFCFSLYPFLKSQHIYLYFYVF